LLLSRRRIDGQRTRIRDRLAGQHVTLLDLVLVERVVDPHGRAAPVSLAMQCRSLPASQANGGVKPRGAPSPAVCLRGGHYRRGGAVEQDRDFIGWHGFGRHRAHPGQGYSGKKRYHSPLRIRYPADGSDKHPVHAAPVLAFEDPGVTLAELDASPTEWP
jgi:hypothetical protein